jgi:glutamyl-tRNA synthetase
MTRVRFAPSPTGYLHVGGARTALFNWLLARGRGGVFVLRIEDTDVERSSAEMVEGILDALRWLGLDWDEGPRIGGPYGPYFQSERRDRYIAFAEQLVRGGRAYYCYCTPAELNARRTAAGVRSGEGAKGPSRAEAEVDEPRAHAGSWKYDRTCCALTAAEVRAREAAKIPRAIRFRVPEGPMGFDDLVHGTIEFDGAHIEDFVLVRSDGRPTYQLSVVVDDIDMAITHVVRGDDHVSNTPKQILLYQAAGAEVPRFAHVPLILGPDKKRLSKRHGATSVMEYARQGYLPEAMVNFLALLGWSPGSDREIFTRAELIDAFAIEGISGGNAVFNPEKLEWFNQQHIMRLAPEELARRVRPWLEAEGLWRDELLGDRHAWFFAVIDLFRPRVKRLGDLAAQARYFFTDTVEYDRAAVEKHLGAAGMAEHLAALAAAFEALPAFDIVSTEGALRATAAARGVKAASLIHAVRVAVTGTSVSPGLFDVLALLGRERVRTRMLAAVREAAARSPI